MTSATKSGRRQFGDPPKTVATVKELAIWCGVTAKTITTWKAMAGFPVEADGTFSPYKVGEWRAIRTFEPPSAELAMDDADDGNTSEALEKWRYERFLMARLDRLEREGQLLRRDWVHAFMLRVASLFRGWGERMNRFSSEAGQLQLDCLEDIEAVTEREFGSDCEPTAGDRDE